MAEIVREICLLQFPLVNKNFWTYLPRIKGKAASLAKGFLPVVEIFKPLSA
jgi:hypothetical protein